MLFFIVVCNACNIFQPEKVDDGACAVACAENRYLSVVTGKERRGFFLIIPDDEYAQGGATNRWENLKVNKDWLLKTTKGKTALKIILKDYSLS